MTHRLQNQPEQSFQLIWPHSDLLLHDMGEGLADHRPEARATGTEWRTPPLWGIGLTAQVSGHSYFLHDGRARNLLEAVLWHGGEAQAARDAVIALPKTRPRCPDRLSGEPVMKRLALMLCLPAPPMPMWPRRWPITRCPVWPALPKPPPR